MHGVGIRGGVDGDRLNPHFAAGAVDAQRDLAPVRDEDFFEQRWLYQGALIVTPGDRVCGPSGRRGAAGDNRAGTRLRIGIVKAFRHPPTGRMRDRNGVFPGLSGSVAHAFRCPASERRTLLAENPGKLSPCVTINAPWYYSRMSSGSPNSTG